MRRPWAAPLVPLYGAGAWAQGRLRGSPKTLAQPVISVGSLSAGGAGKTPVVLMLARLLQEHGVVCDVLSRGYGREAATVERVDPAGDAQRFGDEPLEMARSGFEVWVGRDRHAAGLEAERVGAAACHLLDDGFQHRRLARQLDVVLLTQADVADALLPAGNLREPLLALRRADVLVVREEEAAALQLWTAGRTVWQVRRTMHLPGAAPRHPVAFCGVARPQGFFAGLAALGCTPAAKVSFADHHRYRGRDAARLLHLARDSGADGFVTTAKDAVKLTARLRARLEPITVAELRTEPLDPDAIWRGLQQVLQPA